VSVEGSAAPAHRLPTRPGGDTCDCGSAVTTTTASSA